MARWVRTYFAQSLLNDEVLEDLKSNENNFFTEHDDAVKLLSRNLVITLLLRKSRSHEREKTE